MFGLSLTPVAIAGGNGARSSLFSSGVGDGFRAQPWAPARRTLGQTAMSRGETNYRKAKEEIAEFDALVVRLKKIANRQVREELAEEYGLTAPDNRDLAQYERNASASDVARAESYTPTNYYIFDSPGPAKNRPYRLEDWNHDLRRDVDSAEAQWGSLPDPQIIERVVEVQVPGAAAPSSGILPVLVIGGAAVAVLALLGVFGGK